MKLIKIIVLISISLYLSGCSTFYAYVPPVQQGKEITPEMIKLVKPNMTKSQVEYILGSPALVTPYNDNAWVYVYTIKQNHKPMEEKKLIVTFEKNKLKSIEGDYPPPKVIYNRNKPTKASISVTTPTSTKDDSSEASTTSEASN